MLGFWIGVLGFWIGMLDFGLECWIFGLVFTFFTKMSYLEPARRGISKNVM